MRKAGFNVGEKRRELEEAENARRKALDQQMQDAGLKLEKR